MDAGHVKLDEENMEKVGKRGMRNETVKVCPSLHILPNDIILILIGMTLKHNTQVKINGRVFIHLT